MIGPKKLDAIKTEIQQALAKTGGDPIHELERLMTAAKSNGESTEVMEGLSRFLKAPMKPKAKQRRLKAKS